MDPKQSVVSFLVDGIATEANLIRVPEMSLSSAKANMIEAKFSLVIPVKLLCETATAAWDDHVARCKANDAKHGGPDGDDWVAMAGYPSLETVIEDPDELDFLFGEGGRLLAHSLETICCFNNKTVAEDQQYQYFYLSERTVRLEGDDVLIKGACNRMKP